MIRVSTQDIKQLTLQLKDNTIMKFHIGCLTFVSRKKICGTYEGVAQKGGEYIPSLDLEILAPNDRKIPTV